MIFRSVSVVCFLASLLYETGGCNPLNPPPGSTPDVSLCSRKYYVSVVFSYKCISSKWRGIYRDGSKGRNKGSLHSKDTQATWHHPYTFVCCFFLYDKEPKYDVGIVSCSFVCLRCVMNDPLFLPFSCFVYPLHFEQNGLSTCWRAGVNSTIFLRLYVIQLSVLQESMHFTYLANLTANLASNQRKNSRPFNSIRCTLRCLTKAVPLSNLPKNSPPSTSIFENHQPEN